MWVSTRCSALLPGAGWVANGEAEVAGGGVIGAGADVDCASATPGSASNAAIAAEAKYFDRIGFIGCFLAVMLPAAQQKLPAARARWGWSGPLVVLFNQYP
jgi:hypothetical protein